MKKSIQLFFTFLNIGAFTFGGGYAMLSLVEKAVVTRRNWISSDDFWDLITVVQALPGVFAINTALYVGYKIDGIKGAIFGMLGAMLPSVIIITLIAMFFSQFKDNQTVESIFKGIRPCVVALILAPAIKMLIQAKITWKTAYIPIATVALVWLLKISPIYIIMVVIIGSIMFAYFSAKHLKNKQK